jgi:hypothetical protein
MDCEKNKKVGIIDVGAQTFDKIRTCLFDALEQLAP